MEKADFRFFNSLNDFLPHKLKSTVVHYQFTGSPAIKDSIEAIGIPHTEVDTIVVNGVPVDFFYSLQDQDVAEVHPFESIKDVNANSLTPGPVYPLSFIADVHAGKLAKALRLLGFDTFYHNKLDDQQVADIAEKENRIVLTRDIGLLKYKKIKWGYWLRSQQVNEQLLEVINRFDLSNHVKPFSRCIECNGNIRPVKKEAIQEILPPKTNEYFNEFYQCSSCKKVYWKGSHYENMLKKIADL